MRASFHKADCIHEKNAIDILLGSTSNHCRQATNSVIVAVHQLVRNLLCAHEKKKSNSPDVSQSETSFPFSTAFANPTILDWNLTQMPTIRIKYLQNV